MPRKRTHDEMEATEPQQEKAEPSLLQRIRNMWEFAAVMQYIFMFGKAVKIDEDFDIEDFETECLKPGHSEKLEEIGLTLLKSISSHRGLNYEIWDEYTRRQYLAKAPHLNPYGDEEEPKKFRDFDIFQKIRVLHQLTVWTFWNPDRIRDRMPEHQREVDQLEWRVEELGYDREDRQYYLLDDNRLYRRTEPPLPPAPKAKPKYTSKKAQAARRRASKQTRLRQSTGTPEAEDLDGEETRLDNVAEQHDTPSSEVDTFGGYKWECIAVSLTDYQDFCESLKKSKDPDEKALRERLIDEVIPIIEGAEEKQRRKMERREKELVILEKLASAKRSSRIADKQERERREHDAAEAERKHAADLAAAHREKERQERMEQERQSRMMTREQRIRDREYRRLLKEEELVRAAEEQRLIEEGQARGSERQLKERIEKNRKELAALKAEEEWTFDCSGCGMHGKNLDDGSHSVACERCNVWQHSKCLGISQAAADKEDFHFICKDCRGKEEEANRPKISLKFRVGSSSSPVQPQSPAHPPAPSPSTTKFVPVQVPTNAPARPPSQGSLTNGSRQPQSASPSRPAASPYAQGPTQPNGYPPYGGGYPQFSYTAPHYPYPFSSPPPYRPGPTPSSSPPQPPAVVNNHAINGHSPPSRSSASPQSHAPYYAGPNSPQAPATIPYGQYSPYYNGMPYHHQSYPVAPPLAQSQSTPRPASTHAHANGQNSSNRTPRVPSPVSNRPTMTPTQGNYDVGPLAGITQKSPPPMPNAAAQGHQGNGAAVHRRQEVNGVQQATPRPSSLSSGQTPGHLPPPQLSGLSPTKQPIPLSASSNISQKTGTSPGSATVPARSISGTPIFPPAKTLSPSPEQLQKTAVPTPRKQPMPAEVEESERKRASTEATTVEINNQNRPGA